MATSTTSSTYGLLCFARGGEDPSAQATAQPQKPLLPEIHLNIWEQEADKKSVNTDSLLDIGLMIDVNDQTDSIEFIFPAKMPLTSVKDLAPVASPAQAIPAIFNESWAVVSMGAKDAVVYDPSGQSTSFAFVHIEGAIKEVQHPADDALSICIPTLITRAKGVARQTQRTIRGYISDSGCSDSKGCFTVLVRGSVATTGGSLLGRERKTSTSALMSGVEPLPI